jgi:DNA-binding NarL/FixJ family response regulator
MKLTPREEEVLEYKLVFMPNKTIAKKLKITESCIKFHFGNILKKYKVKNRYELWRKLNAK